MQRSFARLSVRSLAVACLVALCAAPTPAAGGEEQPTCSAGARYQAESATIVGTPGPDEIEGTEGRDVIVGLGGDDTIDAGGGYDRICGDAGDDAIRGGSDPNSLIGGAGDDRLVGGDDGNDLFGKGGDDKLIGGEGWNSYYAELGDDRIVDNSSDSSTDIELTYAPRAMRVDLAAGTMRGMGRDRIVGSGIKILRGTPYRDVLLGSDRSELFYTAGYAGSAPDRIEGHGGDDSLNGSGTLFGGGGDDYISSDYGSGDSELHGGPGTDWAGYHTVSADLRKGVARYSDGSSWITDRLRSVENLSGSGELLGDEGPNALLPSAAVRADTDILRGRGGDDILGYDSIQETSPPLHLWGGAGDDTLYGSVRADRLFGGPGDDAAFGEKQLYYGFNDDLLDGGEGFDDLDGGRGEDECLNGEALVSCEAP